MSKSKLKLLADGANITESGDTTTITAKSGNFVRLQITGQAIQIFDSATGFLSDMRDGNEIADSVIALVIGKLN